MGVPSAGISKAPMPSASQIIVTIGINIPKIPHDVPMEKLIRAAITKIRTPRRDVASVADLLLFSFAPAHLPYASLPPDFETRLKEDILPHKAKGDVRDRMHKTTISVLFPSSHYKEGAESH